jgi:hypothetical protein
VVDRIDWRGIAFAIFAATVLIVVLGVLATGIISRATDVGCVEHCLVRQDLAMQTNMALAAWAMAFVTAVSFVVGAVSLYFLRENLRETRSIGEAQTRAYMIVVGAWLTPSAQAGYWNLCFKFRNSGQTPALAIRTDIRVYYEIATRRGWKQLPTHEKETRQRSDLASQIDGVSEIRLFTEELRRAQKMTTTGAVRAEITIQYADVFGRPWEVRARYRATFTPFNKPDDLGTDMMPMGENVE